MLKRLLACALAVVLLLSLCSCRIVNETLTDKSKLAMMQWNDNSELTWSNKVYTSYGPIPNDGVIGKWFGRVEGEDYSRIYACKNQQTEHWLIYLDSTVMGTYCLYKEKSVTDIPEDFAENSWEKIAGDGDAG